MVAIMAKYSPFAEKAGMQKIVEQQSVKNVSAISKMLMHLGFNLQLLGSERHVGEKLEGLNPPTNGCTQRSLRQKQSSEGQKRIRSQPPPTLRQNLQLHISYTKCQL